MTLTTHTVIGAAIGSAVGQPLLSFSLAFASHLLVDMIPHGDGFIANNFFVQKRKRRQALAYVTIDAVCSVLLLLFLINTKDLESLRALSWGVFGGVLPDVLVGLNDLTRGKYLWWFNRIHFFFHDFFMKRYGDIPLKFALAGQFVFILWLQTRIG